MGVEPTGFVAASDAFFPFRDNVDVLAEHGVTAIIQPGGSVRDDESIKACDDHDIAINLHRHSSLPSLTCRIGVVPNPTSEPRSYSLR